MGLKQVEQGKKISIFDDFSKYRLWNYEKSSNMEKKWQNLHVVNSGYPKIRFPVPVPPLAAAAAFVAIELKEPESLARTNVFLMMQELEATFPENSFFQVVICLIWPTLAPKS